MMRTLFAIAALAGLAAARVPQELVPPRRVFTRCPGCRFGTANLAPGYVRGWRVTVAPDFAGKLRPSSVAALGWSGLCIERRGCVSFVNCRMGVLAVILNTSGADLWFQVDEWWRTPKWNGVPQPDKDGWVRVPHGRSALYLAGNWEVACLGVPRVKSMTVVTKKNGGKVAAKFEWAATCSRCVEPTR